MSCTAPRSSAFASLLLVAALASPCLANGWTPLTNQPPASASTMLLLTDGRIFMNDGGSQHWWLFTPDANGSYVNGTWSQLSPRLSIVRTNPARVF